MSSTQLMQRQGSILPVAAPVFWRELCAIDVVAAPMALQGGTADFGGSVMTDHKYSTRMGPPSCSPPV